ncbi:MAG TPA: hypothetical protein VFF16_14400 [Telluria sp.]|nr:hypothetical protein [Telluria sp.]
MHTLTTDKQAQDGLQDVHDELVEQVAELRAAALLARAASGAALVAASTPRARWYRRQEEELAQWLASGGFRSSK